jgi:hypothetical protein
MAELKGIEYLRQKLMKKQYRVKKRYDFYDMKNIVRDLGIATPPQLAHWTSTLGWCGKAVDSLADRLVFREFENDNFSMNEIFQMNNPDILASSAILAALIGSCSFIYIYADNDGYPKLETIDGGNATGEIDQVTGLLTEGYAVLKRDEYGHPQLEAYFIPNQIQYFEKGEQVRVFRHKVGHPLLVPIIYRPDSTRPFGHSRISRACMNIMESAVRTAKRSEIAAEFYSYPQKYAVGLSEDATKLDKWKASMSSMLTFTKDEEGDHPILGQFQQQSMAPHLDQLRMFASLFAGETGLTLDDLGFPSDNPSSADAIRSQHESLRLSARRAQRNFGTGLLNAGFLAACLRDEYAYQRRLIYLTIPTWAPIFEPDASQLSGIGDAIIKIQQAFPDYFDEQKLRNLTGI